MGLVEETPIINSFAQSLMSARECETLLDTLPEKSKLKKLTLSGIIFTGAPPNLKAFDNFEDLYLEDSGMSVADCNALLKTLSGGSKLKRLSLSGSNFSAATPFKSATTPVRLNLLRFKSLEFL